jgi:WD repeat-containing protein 19
MGKHSKRIVTGDWNQDGLLSKLLSIFYFLVTAGEDKIFTISNYNSDT